MLEPVFYWITKPSRGGPGLRVAQYPVETDEGWEKYPNYFELEEVDVCDRVLKSILISEDEARKLMRILKKMGIRERRMKTQQGGVDYGRSPSPGCLSLP